LCTGIEKNANFRVEDTAKSVEELSVRVNLLAVLGLQAENHLLWRQARWIVISGSDELLIGGDRQLSSVFELWGYKVKALAKQHKTNEKLLLNPKRREKRKKPKTSSKKKASDLNTWENEDFNFSEGKLTM